MSEVYFAGPLGRIEGRYYQNSDPSSPAALVLHPHPLHGGTMNNKVTYHLFKTFVNTGFSVLRVNFPGVGRSEGQFDDGVNEFHVASAALDWLQNHNIEASHFWIGGFSFGSWIGMHLVARRPEVEGFVFISPPVKSFDFSFAIPCPTSGLIVQGDSDSIVKLEDVNKVVQEWQRQCAHVLQYDVIEGADHFFVNHIDSLDQTCADYINTRLAIRIAKPVRKKRRRRKKRDHCYESFDES